jgi:hypothetical protein
MSLSMRFEVFTEMTVQIVVFSAVISFSLVIGGCGLSLPFSFMCLPLQKVMGGDYISAWCHCRRPQSEMSR